jgi:UPF0755 protein
MKKLLTLIGFLFLCWAFWAVWYAFALGAIGNDTTKQIVKIPKGSSVSFIADELEKEGLIHSSFAFRLYVKRAGKASSLQAGNFPLSPSMSVQEIVDTLAGGKAGQVVITVPEGFTVAEIDNLLADKDLIQPGDLLHCAKTCDFSSFEFLPKGCVEGYLYPDTYFVLGGEEFVPKFFMERMFGVFRQRVVDGLKGNIKASVRSLSDIIIMASLIEAETRTNEERPVVAGILWKRFDQKMGLGVDASVRYALDKPTGPLTQSDLEIDSPYNLRKYRGLPPTPIANPGLSSIKAALHPVDSPYFYYLHDSQGTIHYAVTNDEQNVNRAKYLR